MKTLTVNLRGTPIASYRGVQLHVFTNQALIAGIEYWALDLGFTHIKWLRIPLGKGTQTCKIRLPKKVVWA